MSLRTMPDPVRTSGPFEPSAGYGPAVSDSTSMVAPAGPVGAARGVGAGRPRLALGGGPRRGRGTGGRGRGAGARVVRRTAGRRPAGQDQGAGPAERGEQPAARHGRQVEPQALVV